LVISSENRGPERELNKKNCAGVLALKRVAHDRGRKS